MASVDDVEPGSPEKQPISPPSINTDIENPNTDCKQSIECASISDKRGSCLTCQMPIPKPIRYIFFTLLFVCLAPVAYVCVIVATVGVLPLLLAAFVVVRLLQFVIRSENFEKNFIAKLLLHYWMFVVVTLLLVEAGIFYPIARYISLLQPVMIIGLSITKWIKIICIVIGIYLLSQLVWVLLVYMIAQIDTGDGGSGALVLESVSEIIGCILFRWAERVVMGDVPTFKESKVAGLHTQKWIEVSLYVLIGYNIITLLTHLLVWWLPKVYGDYLGVENKNLKTALSLVCCDDIGEGAFNKKYVVYVACGVKRSIIFILSAVMLLFTWVLYFGDRLNTTSQNKKVLAFGTWTLISILVCSFFWLIKSCILLYWEAQSVYDRLHAKIEDTGKQLYFVLLLANTSYPSLADLPKDTDDSACCLSSCCATPPNEESLTSKRNLYQTIDRKSIRQKLIKKDNDSEVSIYGIQQAADQFLDAQYASSTESCPNYLIASGDNNANDIEKLKLILEDEGEAYSQEDWNLFLKLLSVEPTTENISFQEVKTWMERANSRCNFLANTLISEKEVVKCLNQVISGLIIGATFIIWLILTELATTSVIVLLASPLLAATFVFGDTCKSLFQGLIFVYIVHPFDVGDLCFIDEKLLEVKRIGVWSTVFTKVRTIGNKEQIIYPNSDLAVKNVINHKSEFDWNDHIVFNLSYSDEETANRLKSEIESYLDSEKDKFVPNFHSVEFLEMGNEDKVAVHIKHKVRAEGWTNFECLKEKEKRRFEFAVYVRNLVNRQKPKTGLSDTNMNEKVIEDD